MKLKQFRVEGSGDFPFDMLRYVPCWPATEPDSSHLYERETKRTVTMETMSGSEITPDRWASFLWRVVK